jgi:hypothetical protein
MRALRGRLGWLLALGALLAPGLAYGQGQDNFFPAGMPDPNLPIPLNPHLELGGIYGAGQFLYMTRNIPLGSQTVAIRGFVDADGSITGGTPGTFVGSKTEALNVNQVGGRSTYEPGYGLTLGWKFQDGIAVEVNWWHLLETQLAAQASLIPKNFAVGADTSDSFLFSPVFNFPVDYAGPPLKIPTGNNQAMFGIWNGATNEQIRFIQRLEKVDITGRIPLEETDTWRTYALFGGRAIVMWEQFKWRTVDVSKDGITEPEWTADYFNLISQRMYGPHCGCGNEWWLGGTPLGGLSVLLNLDGALLMDFVKERVEYRLESLTTAARRAHNTYTIAPEAEGELGFMWYPTQAIQVKFSWQAMAIFNTIASPEPIDFNFGSIDPAFKNGFTRLFHGFFFGVSFAF